MDENLRERYLIAKMFARHREALSPQPFESEVDRWLELVIAFLEEAGSVNEAQVREAVSILSALGLLQPTGCARLEPASPEGGLITEVLRDHGFNEAQSAQGLTIIVELAQGVQSNWDGKIQHYLRDWARRMVNEMPDHLPTGSLAPEVARRALAGWLRTALGLPIILNPPLVEQFAQEHDTSIDALVAGADALDLNVALLDEMVANEMALTGTSEG
jgi:hypothetical protein